MSHHTTRRIPKLAFTKTRGIGWHVAYRDPVSGVPRKYSFGVLERDKASELYNVWLVEHLRGAPHRSRSETNDDPAEVKKAAGAVAKVTPGSLQGRVIMRIELLPQAKERLMALSNRLGMTHVAITSRLVEWLCDEHDVVQAVVLGLYPEDIRSDLPSKIFKRIAAGRKKPALA